MGSITETCQGHRSVGSLQRAGGDGVLEGFRLCTLFYCLYSPQQGCNSLPRGHPSCNPSTHTSLSVCQAPLKTGLLLGVTAARHLSLPATASDFMFTDRSPDSSVCFIKTDPICGSGSWEEGSKSDGRSRDDGSVSVKLTAGNQAHTRRPDTRLILITQGRVPRSTHVPMWGWGTEAG